MSLRLLKNMAKAPTEFYQHIPRFPASLVFALAFGREMKHYELAEVLRILVDFVFEINPGAHLRAIRARTDELISLSEWRWSPIVPLSFPHYLDVNDEYKGYKIKKGTTVISTDGTDSVVLGEGMYGFGLGRRECPGQKMGTKSAWIAIVRLLWAFNIEAVFDASGKPTTIDTESCTEGLICRPHASPANFVARSAAHIETFMSS